MVKSLSASRKPVFAFVTPAEHPNLNGFGRVFESKQASDNLSIPSFNPSFSADFPQILFWIQVKSEKKKKQKHSSEFFQPLSFGIVQWQFLLVVPCEKYQRNLERKKLVILDITSLPFLSSCHSSVVYFSSKWTDKLAFRSYPQKRRTHVWTISKYFISSNIQVVSVLLLIHLQPCLIVWVCFSFSITFYYNLMLFLPFYRQRHWDLPVL